MKRPLGAFSDFIINELPELLEDEISTIEAGAAIALDNLDKRIVEQAFQSDRQLAAYDFKMLECGLYHSGAGVPEKLIQLIDRFTENSCSGLTYEDLILCNPPEDMRLFSQGAAAESERLFYRNHRIIEEILLSIIVDVQEALAASSIKGLGYVGCRDKFGEMLARLHELESMPDGHFNVFRKYFKTNEVRGSKGPSGAFSARFPILELLFRGDILPEERFEYIANHQQYFPVCDMDLMSTAIDVARSGRTLIHLGDKRQPGISVLSLFESFFEAWRSGHLQAVSKQLPEVFMGAGAGTSGEKDVRRFLTDRMMDDG